MTAHITAGIAIVHATAMETGIGVGAGIVARIGPIDQIGTMPTIDLIAVQGQTAQDRMGESL